MSEDLVEISHEQKHIFLSFCSFMCITANKKLNLANIFILLLKDKSLRELFMKLNGFDTEFEALQSFLQYDLSLPKSKYIKKFLTTSKIKLKNKTISYSL
jgi:hypothetical protein